ncbi:hypothetical protein [uncultured Sphingomonas sp.]|uniref:hypothetical protein n=1 Tax=uncultured Sphingomonas sp. TaxID=158754 RepID=UPI0035C9C321
MPGDKLDFDPAEFGEAFTGPTSADSDAAHFQNFTARTLRDLATLKANDAQLHAVVVDWLRKAVDRDKVIAARLVDPADLARHAEAGARQGAAALAVQLRQLVTDEDARRAAHATRIVHDDHARHLHDGRRVTHARILAAIGGAAALLVAGAGWLGYDKGKDAGVAYGYAGARDEKAAVDWANTANGRLARRLDRASPTALPAILGCTGKGWKRTKQDGRRVCLPSGAEGWWLP